jgi:NADH dehydrogenase FAD-containing subunit
LKNLILCGAGHAHLELLKGINSKDFQGWRVVLVTPEKDYFYSGSLPRFLMGEIQSHELMIDLTQICRSKNVELIIGSYQSHANKSVLLTSGVKLDFDLLSLNLGGTLSFLPDSREVLHLRPISDFVKQWEKINLRWETSGVENVAVVGGGPAGIEISAALRCRQLKLLSPQCSVHLFTEGSLVGSVYGNEGAVNLTQDLLRLGVKIHFNHKVHDFTHIKNEFPVVLSALPLKSWGFQINNNLQLENSVFAAGDCVEMKNGKTHKKSGVLSVQQGRWLLKNIVRTLHQKPLIPFPEPQKTLNLLINGQSTARLQWGSFSWSGAGIKWLKKTIDDRYIRSLQIH